jgi:hypothetical protein
LSARSHSPPQAAWNVLAIAVQQLGNWFKKLASPLTRMFQWIAEGQEKQPICKT